MNIHFKIQDKISGGIAEVDELLNIHSADEVLKNKLQLDIDFANMHSGYIKPILLVFYEETKRNATFKIIASKGALRALKRKPQKGEIN